MRNIGLTISDIKNVYRGVKHKAIVSTKEGRYEDALHWIRNCATIAQQFNWIYTDEDLETLLREISLKLIPDSFTEYVPIKNRVILYDDFCRSFILALQYIDALLASGMEVIYITIRHQSSTFSTILPLLEEKYPTVKVIALQHINRVQSNIDLYDEIVKLKPEKVLFHIYAHSSIIPVIYRLPQQIDTYIVNLADQTFWLGSRAIKYVLEFRQFGVSVSQQRRGIKPEQQLLVPFYPIIDNNLFQGFPKECTEQGKVLIFSGGDIYKVLDDKRMYWHLVKRIMDTFSEVVFLFATKEDYFGVDFLQKFIKDNHYEGRFIYTKFRPDINEVMAHADIFMGTCPVCGSLMSQLAARNATPILQYYYPETPDDETEQAICINEQYPISFDNEDAFMREAEKLIRNADYRTQQGERLQRAMITEDQFNELVKNTLASNKTQIPLQPYEFDYKQLDDRWFALEKAGYISSFSYLYGLLGKKDCLRFAPKLFIKKQLNTLINILNI